MATTRRFSPFVWITWANGLLSHEQQCLWASWFRSNFKHTKVERDDSALAQWQAEHGEIVQARAASLEAEGWTVYREAQNKFFLKGKSATLAGMPDIVALSPDRATALIVDCKSGQRRAKDVWQVLLYMFALPLTHHPAGGVRLVGEVRYRDGAVAVAPEELTVETKTRIVALLQRLGDPGPPTRTPSAQECAWCDIGPNDCPERIDAPAAQEVAVDAF